LSEPASVLSVLSAGKGGQVDLNDLGLKKSYSGTKAMLQSMCYNDLMVAVSSPADKLCLIPTLTHPIR